MALKSYPTSMTGKINFDEKQPLGSGYFSTVFHGIYESEPVAVKKFNVGSVNITLNRKISFEPSTLDHENVLKILTVEQDGDFR